jgi:hypothetical protein
MIATGATAEEVPITCDALLVEPDGTINLSPVATALPGFHTVASARRPPTLGLVSNSVSASRARRSFLASSAQGLPIVAQNDFLRVHSRLGVVLGRR